MRDMQPGQTSWVTGYYSTRRIRISHAVGTMKASERWRRIGVSLVGGRRGVNQMSKKATDNMKYLSADGSTTSGRIEESSGAGARSDRTKVPDGSPRRCVSRGPASAYCFYESQGPLNCWVSIPTLSDH